MRFAALVITTMLVAVTGCFGSVEGEECWYDACTPPPQKQPDPQPQPQPRTTETTPAPPIPSAPPPLATDAGGPNKPCPEPYHGLAPDGRCVWSCAIGTEPDVATNECVCQPGREESGKDEFDRRVCK